MNTFLKTTAAAILALGALGAGMTSPAMAQVNGFATVDTELAVAQSKALQTAYQQINTTFDAQIKRVSAIQQEINTLNAQLDTDGNKELTQAEVDKAVAAKSPVLAQIDAKQQEAAGLTNQIARSQVYAIEQILQQLSPALQQVIADKKISIMLSPDAMIYAPDGVNVTQAFVAALDTRIPAVSTAIPANWQPNRQSVAFYERVQQLLSNIRQAQAARAAQQPAAAPEQQAPVGR